MDGIVYHFLPGDSRVMTLRWIGEDIPKKGLVHDNRYEVQLSVIGRSVMVGYHTETAGTQTRNYENIFVFLKEWSSF